jgi:hypothetical protein
MKWMLKKLAGKLLFSFGLLGIMVGVMGIYTYTYFWRPFFVLMVGSIIAGAGLKIIRNL